MSKEAAFARNFEELAGRAGIDRTCRVEFPVYMAERNAQDPRAFAEVDPARLCFYFAPAVLGLPREHQRGLIAHELGHVLAYEMGLPGGGSEEDADKLALDVMGVRVQYDCRWPGKGLQRTENPEKGQLRLLNPHRNPPLLWLRSSLPSTQTSQET